MVRAKKALLLGMTMIKWITTWKASRGTPRTCPTPPCLPTMKTSTPMPWRPFQLKKNTTQNHLLLHLVSHGFLCFYDISISRNFFQILMVKNKAQMPKGEGKNVGKRKRKDLRRPNVVQNVVKNENVKRKQSPRK